MRLFVRDNSYSRLGRQDYGLLLLARLLIRLLARSEAFLELRKDSAAGTSPTQHAPLFSCCNEDSQVE